MRVATLRSCSRFSLIVIVLLASSAGWAQIKKMKPYPKPQKDLSAGHRAPDFTLKDQNGSPFTLSKQQGKWVLLVFYRGYW